MAPPRGRAGALWRAAAMLLGFALTYSPGRPPWLLAACSGRLPAAGRRVAVPGSRLTRTAAPWDALFGNREPVELPSTMEKLNEELQSSMMTSVEKALPRIDMELPPGLRIGIETQPGKVAPRREAPTLAERMRGDRELAAGFAMLFAGLKNSKSLCVAFRNPKLANLAKRNWGDMGGVRIISLPNPKQAFGEARSIQDRARRPFLIAVAPSREQLLKLRELDEERGGKFCLILLNAGLRGLAEPDELRDELAAASNPAFHVRFAGPKGQDLVYHRLGLPWVVARRKAAEGGDAGEFEFEEVSRSDNEPSYQEVEAALAR
uniref:DUF1995 domain-containing protein n=1 Tax=Alexandrium monilatum TaxID=311494 RepID=A0A7S4PRX1_9DINO